VMTAAALVSSWWRQPATNEEFLANGQLKLGRQVRRDREAKPESPTPWINVGSWRLYDRRDELLVDGRYRNGLPHGRWTLYYSNGQKAAQGALDRGQRTGVWRTWNERGQLVSQVAYRPDPERADRPMYEKYQLPNPPNIGCGSSIYWRWGTRKRREIAAPPLPAVRHGAARMFSQSGELRWTGRFENDRLAR
jgi:hypothetical protein